MGIQAEGEKSKIVIRIASPARANNNCWLLLLEDNSKAGTEHHCAPSKHRAICSVDILVSPSLLPPLHIFLSFLCCLHLKP